jgi:uncharacterized protein
MKSAVIDITVVPKSSRSQIQIDEKDNIKAYLNSPPADGKANAELIKLLSKVLDIPKSWIRIIKGEKGRKKKISFEGLSKDAAIKMLKIK